MRILKAAVVPAVALAAGFLGGVVAGRLGPGRPTRDGVLDELNVKRVNIVEEDGRPALVMANSQNLPGGVRDGKQSGMRAGIPGLIFYNSLGDEIGGLIYPARKLEAGYDGGVQLSMDQIKQTGQAVALRHWRSGDYVRSMLEITDYSTEKFAGDANEDPEIAAVLKRLGEAGEEEQERIFKEEYLPLLGEKGYLAHRVFLGSEGADRRRAMLELKDSRSRPRIRLIVDEDDRPRIDILDERGRVVSGLK
jgi:hypothetical protein